MPTIEEIGNEFKNGLANINNEEKPWREMNSSQEHDVSEAIWWTMLFTASYASLMFLMVPYEEWERKYKAFSDNCETLKEILRLRTRQVMFDVRQIQMGEGVEQTVQIPEEPQSRSQTWSEYFKSLCPCLWGRSTQPTETTSLLLPDDSSGQQPGYGAC